MKNLYLNTDLGTLDVLGELPELGEVVNVIARAKKIQLFGHTMNILSIEDLIQTKNAMGRPKDIMMVHELEKIRN